MSRSHLLPKHCAPKAPRACRVSIPNPIIRGAIGENRRRIPLSANPIHEHDAILTRKPRAGRRQKNDAPSLQSKRWHDPQHRLPRPNLPTAEIHRRAGAIHERQELPTRHRVLRLQLNRKDLHPSTADCRCRRKHERRQRQNMATANEIFRCIFSPCGAAPTLRCQMDEGLTELLLRRVGSVNTNPPHGGHTQSAG